jgi:hypothetical protein
MTTEASLLRPAAPQEIVPDVMVDIDLVFTGLEKTPDFVKTSIDTVKVKSNGNIELKSVNGKLVQIEFRIDQTNSDFDSITFNQTVTGSLETADDAGTKAPWVAPSHVFADAEMAYDGQGRALRLRVFHTTDARTSRYGLFFLFDGKIKGHKDPAITNGAHPP